MQFSGFSILHVFLFLLLTTPALINAAAAPTSDEEMIKYIGRGAKSLFNTPNAIPGEMEKRDLEGDSLSPSVGDSPPPTFGEDINAPKGGGGGRGGGGGGGGGGGKKSGGGGGGGGGTSGATAVKVGSLGALIVAAAGVGMLF